MALSNVPVDSSGRAERVRGYKRKYRLANREKILAKERKRYADNLEKERERSRKYRANNPDKRLESQRNLRTKHHDKYLECNRKYRAENIEKTRAAVRKYAAANPDVHRAAAHRRRISIKNSTSVAPTAKQITELMKDPCVYCGLPSEHMDHVIPLSRGGEHTLDNVVPACAKCNFSKGSKLPVIEWRGRAL